MSAVKIDGTRAYKLHRQGIAIEMPIRTLHVHELRLDDYTAGTRLGGLRGLLHTGASQRVGPGRERSERWGEVSLPARSGQGELDLEGFRQPRDAASAVVTAAAALAFA